MFVCSLPLLSALFTACAPVPPLATGYVEGQYVLIAPVASARLAEVSVARGDRVDAGAPFARQESRDAEIALAEAEAALAGAEARLANLREGRRAEEIAVIEASLASARAQEAELAREHDRLVSLKDRAVTTQARLDQAATQLAVARAKVAEGEASLAVARLPARPGEIAAAEAAVAGARATRERARWALGERALVAPASGLVQDILRESGEIAGPQAPVASFLPDGALRLRLYLPEISASAVQVGTLLDVSCDGCAPQQARVTYISDSPEFTPPVIYSLENRQKLVTLIEAAPLGEGLKPGQIVSVTLP